MSTLEAGAMDDGEDDGAVDDSADTGGKLDVIAGPCDQASEAGTLEHSGSLVPESCWDTAAFEGRVVEHFGGTLVVDACPCAQECPDADPQTLVLDDELGDWPYRA